jgi:hypothetical protein
MSLLPLKLAAELLWSRALYINASATKDSSDPTHMSCEQLEAYLTQVGIKVPANLPKIVLRKLLIENMNTASTDGDAILN